jgi:hypothetical protein
LVLGSLVSNLHFLEGFGGGKPMLFAKFGIPFADAGLPAGSTIELGMMFVK